MGGKSMWKNIKLLAKNGKKLTSEEKEIRKLLKTRLLNGTHEIGRDLTSKGISIRGLTAGNDEEEKLAKFESYTKNIKKFIKNFEAFESKFSSWKNKRSNTIKSLRDLADEIKGYYEKCKVARAAGVGASIGGGLCFIGGFALSCTGIGAVAGAPLMGYGAATGIAGGVTNAGASITDSSIQENRTKKAEQIVEEDQKKTKELTDLLNLIEKDVNQLFQTFGELKDSLLCKYEVKEMVFDSLDIGLIAIDAGLTGYSVAKEGLKESFKFGKYMKVVAPILSVVGLGLDVWEAVSICKESATPESALKLREVANELKKQKDSFEEIFN